jgi:hypothetical protein
MADGSNPAFALAIAQAIARGQGTPQQRSAFNSAVAQQMQANAAAQAALHGGQQAPPGAAGFQPHPIGPAFPGGQQGPPPEQAYPTAPSGGAGLAPPGHPINPGGGIHQGVNPGGPMQSSPGSTLPIGRTGPVRPIGPARPPRPGGVAHWYGPGGTGTF